MIGVLSDIHGNLEALHAVMNDAVNRGIERFYCLGDTVGLGPDPRACVEIVESFEFCLSGNWDYFITGDGTTQSKRPSSELEFWYQWVRSQLSSTQLNFLETRPSVHQKNGKTYAHGDPLDAVNGHLFPETVYERSRMQKYFAAFDGFFFCGHTHIGGVFTETKFEEALQIEGMEFELERNAAIVTVGSVGQPRDGDSRACYLIDYGDSYQFVRVPYDYEITKRKLEDLDRPTK